MLKSKHLLIVIAGLMFLGLSSCQKQIPFIGVNQLNKATTVVHMDNSASLVTSSEGICGEVQSFALVSEEGDVVGTVEISNDQDALFVEIIASEDFLVESASLFIGNNEDIPVEDDGNPNPALFPFQIELDEPLPSMLNSFALGSLDPCYAVSLDAAFVPATEGPGIFSFHSNVSTFSYCTQECDVASDTCVIDTGSFRTQTPGGWGAPANGNNPGVYRDANFDAAFPGGLVVGDPANYTLTLSSAKAVEEFLPSGGKPSALTQSYVDPAGALTNTLASHVVALTLSLTFDAYDADFGASGTNLGDLVFAGGAFEGMTVAEVLEQANIALGGGDTEFSISDLNDILSKVNESFVDGTKVSDEAGVLFECIEGNEDPGPGEDPEEPQDVPN